MVKFVIVTGSLLSGIGKGITSSSLGLLLQSYGLTVTSIKIDPYLNLDSGTLSPHEHGECYVLADGSETDLDLGNYERFLGIELTKHHSITTGKVYQNVLTKERRGDYLGKTVQIVPHITDEIKRLILLAAHKPLDQTEDFKTLTNLNTIGIPDVCMIELGGTIGDIETTPFVEALRQLFLPDRGYDACFVHVSMILSLGENNFKTKPIQHNVAKLRELGLPLDVLILRTPSMLSEEITNKISNFCGIAKENIISNIDVPNIYHVPNNFQKQNIIAKLNTKLHLNLDMTSNVYPIYHTILDFYQHVKQTRRLLLAGKYTGTQDTYLSILRAVEHAMFLFHCKIDVDIQDSEADINLEQYHGVIIPGGFGARGIRGKSRILQYCREHNVPTLGICLGMQIMVCEFAEHVCNIEHAMSSEWDIDPLNDEKKNYVIDMLPGQTDQKGGTMRLGNYTTLLKPNSLVASLYKKTQITERHRHRYEVNPTYVSPLEEKGLQFVGQDQVTGIKEVTELQEHPFYIGCQYHPEFKSTCSNPHPLFLGLLSAMLDM